MMFLPAGFAESTGDRLVTAPAVYMAGNVWYVSSTLGDDAASPAGRERSRPLETLAQAITNAADDDVIVLMDGHTEIISSQLTIGKRLLITASGSSGGIPTVRFRRNFNGIMFNVTASGVQFRNIRFSPSMSSSATRRIKAFTGTRFSGCYFESGDNDTGQVVDINEAGCWVENCTFINTATSTSPGPGLQISTSIEGMYVRDTIFDGGTIGYTNGFAFLAAVAMTDFVGEGITLRNGADFVTDASSTGIFTLSGSGSGGGRVIW